MKKIKIADFCQTHNEEFKTYYNYLNNSHYVQMFLTYQSILYTDRMKQYIMELIKKNHKKIVETVDKIDIIISYYKQNELINKSEIGKFFVYYEKERKGIKDVKLKNKNNIFKLFYKIMEYPQIIEMLKECFYIFSDYRSCIYFMTPSINFYKVNNKNKLLLKNVVHSFKDNINTLNQIITKIYIGDITPWGSPYYTMAYTMFESLMILRKYYKEPLKTLDIKFKVKKVMKNNKDLIKRLCDNYHIKKLKDNEIMDAKINEKYIFNVSQFILILKKLGYDLWYVIFLVFNTIYENYTIKGLIDPIIYTHEKLKLQIRNNELGVMCFILSEKGYITNTHIFNGFND